MTAVGTPTSATAQVQSGLSGLTSGSFTPTASTLLVACWSGTGSVNAQTLASITNTGMTGQGSWSFYNHAPASSSACGVSVAWSRVGSSPTSGTVTTNTTSSSAPADNRLSLFTLANVDTSTPVDLTSRVNTSGTTSISMTLGSTPTVDDMAFVMAGGRNNANTPVVSSGFTFALNDSAGTNPRACQYVEYRTGSTSTSVPALTGMATAYTGAVGLIFKAVSGGGPVVVADVFVWNGTTLDAADVFVWNGSTLDAADINAIV